MTTRHSSCQIHNATATTTNLCLCRLLTWSTQQTFCSSHFTHQNLCTRQVHQPRICHLYNTLPHPNGSSPYGSSQHPQCYATPTAVLLLPYSKQVLPLSCFPKTPSKHSVHQPYIICISDSTQLLWSITHYILVALCPISHAGSIPCPSTVFVSWWSHVISKFSFMYIPSQPCQDILVCGNSQLSTGTITMPPTLAVIIVMRWLEPPWKAWEHHLPIGSKNDHWTYLLVQPDMSWG